MLDRRVIVTAADRRYFGSLTSLLGSVSIHCPGIDRILIYDLGLSQYQRLILRNVRSIQIRQVPPFCPHYLDVGSFAWKTAAICDALDHEAAVLWLDAGVQIEESLDDLFETIERDGYLFAVTPLDHPNCRIGHLSHDRSLELLGADTESFRSSLMVNAGVMGYLGGHSVSDLAYEAMQFAANPEIIRGPRYAHRHDQTIYSVLRVKHNLPAQYNIFHLPNVDAQYPFLIKATGHDIVPDAVASGWSRSKLHVYLLVTRDRRPFDFVGAIEFASNSVTAKLWLRGAVVASHLAALGRKGLGKVRDTAQRLVLDRRLAPGSKPSNSEFSDKD